MATNALKYRSFQIYIAGKFFGLHALWMQRMTLGWIAWDMTETASFVGVVSFIYFTPTLVTGPFFGVLVDRMRVHIAAMLTQSLMLGLTVALWLALTMGWLNQGVLIAMALLLGIVGSAHHPVRMSLAPRLVEKDAIGSVISTVAILFNLTRMSGPALGGWLIVVWGIGGSLIVQILLYVPFIITLASLNPRQNDTPVAAREPFLTALITGVRHVAKERLISRALLITGLVAFAVRGVLEMLPVIADGVFEMGAAGLGLLLSSAGLGALIAGVAKTFIPAQSAGHIPWPTMVVSLTGMVLVPFVGQSSSWSLTLVLIAGMAFCTTMTAITLQTAVQMDLPDDLRGRVMSLWTMTAMGAAAFGAVILGALFDQIGFSTTLLTTGIVGFLCLAFIATKS